MEGGIDKTSSYVPPTEDKALPPANVQPLPSSPLPPKERHWSVQLKENASENILVVSQAYSDTQKKVSFSETTSHGLFTHSFESGGFPPIPFTREFFEHWLKMRKEIDKTLSYQIEEDRDAIRVRVRKSREDLEEKFKARVQEYLGALSRQRENPTKSPAPPE